MKHSLEIHGKDYKLTIHQPIKSKAIVPRLIIPAFQPNKIANQILEVAIASIQRFTKQPHELWIVDNASLKEFSHPLLNQSKFNVILNHTLPQLPKRSFRQVLSNQHLYSSGSYANAIGLEIATQFINPNSHYVMTLHMDTMPCHDNWLNFLLSKINHNTKASGVRCDTTRTKEGILHILGMLFDYQVFRKLKLDYFPELPRFDVGDKISAEIRLAGYKIFHCRNTMWNPEYIDLIQDNSPFKFFNVDRAFDEEDNIIFLHLGRGVNKSKNKTQKGVSPLEWIHFAKSHLLKD